MPIVQITMKGRYATLGVETRNVFYISGVDIGPTQAGGTIDALRTAYATHLAPQLPTLWELYGATWRNVSEPGYGGVDVPFALLTGITNETDLLPPQIAGLVSFRTGTQPPNRGRKYIAGFGEQRQSSGRWTTAVVNALQAWGDAVVNIGSGTGSDRPLGTARIDPVTGLATGWNPYSVAIARDVCATMRSRRIGQGI